MLRYPYATVRAVRVDGLHGLETMLNMLLPNSNIHSIGALVLLVTALILGQGLCCGHDHLGSLADSSGASAEVCLCLCHSTIVSGDQVESIPLVLAAATYPLFHEKPYESIFVDGIDHPPRTHAS